MYSTLDVDVKLTLLASAAMFMWALILGAWKYMQIMKSPERRAHPYTDIAHRAALLYSFALLLIAVLLGMGGLLPWLGITAAAILLAYFVIAVSTYVWHGWRKDTVNQLVDPPTGSRIYMLSLIIAEIGAFGLIVAGFVHAQFISR